MKTKIADIKYNSSLLFNGPKPVNCPYCGAFIEAKTVSAASYPYTKSSIVYYITYQSQCCDNSFFTIYDVSGGKGTLLTMYPAEKEKDFPEAIKLISPRFIKLYNQAYFTEQNNFFDLAGAGYRNAMEVLIKDYAITELGKPHEEVAKKTLFDGINEYVPSVHITASADAVRVLGNDYTHFERKYEDIDFDILKRYIHILINYIENEYLLNHPIVPTNKNIL